MPKKPASFSSATLSHGYCSVRSISAARCRDRALRQFARPCLQRPLRWSKIELHAASAIDGAQYERAVAAAARREDHDADQ